MLIFCVGTPLSLKNGATHSFYLNPPCFWHYTVLTYTSYITRNLAFWPMVEELSLQSGEELWKERPRGVMDKVLNCAVEVKEFELKSLYYVHFWINTPGKSMNIPQLRVK